MIEIFGCKEIVDLEMKMKKDEMGLLLILSLSSPCNMSYMYILPLSCSFLFSRYQTFRYPEKDNNRIRAQLLVQAVTVCNRKVVDPRQFLKECGYDADLIDSITRPHSDKTVEAMFEHFEALDSTFRVAASEDDRLVQGGNEK